MKTDGLKTFLLKAANISEGITVSETSSTYWSKGQGGSGIPDDCLKVGKSSAAGNFTFTLADSYSDVDRVVVTGYGWKATSSVSVNSLTAQKPSAAATETTFTFDLTTSSKSIAVKVTSSAVCVTKIELFAKKNKEDESNKQENGLSWSAESASVTYGSESYNLPTLNNANNLTVSYASSDSSVATIDDNGHVTINNVTGSTEISASFAGDEVYKSGTVAYTLNVTRQIVIEDGIFNFDEDYTALIPSLEGTSSSNSTAGDITEDVTVKAGNVTFVIVAAESGTANRVWNSSPRLRLYSGTHTFSVPQGYVITEINIKQGKWNDGNTFNNEKSSSSNWTGSDQTVELGIAGNTQIKSIEVKYEKAPAEADLTFSITNAKWATYVGKATSSFPTGVKGYIVSATTETSVSLTEVSVITEGTPVLVSGNAGDYEMDAADEADLEFNENVSLDSNLLQVVGTNESVKSAYVLANKGKVAFYLYEGNGLDEGQVYLPTTAGARQMLAIDGYEATGIKAIEATTVQMGIYTLQGQRVGLATRGLYIVNGKKLIVK